MRTLLGRLFCLGWLVVLPFGCAKGTAAGATSGGGDEEPECGNGVLEPGEDCDLGSFGGRTCESEGFGSGSLWCTETCTIDGSSCDTCGNGILEPWEECDGADLGGLTSCADIDAGDWSEPLTCLPWCAYDFSNCASCGDRVVTEPEDCEPALDSNSKPDLNGFTCKSLGWQGGSLDCLEGCRFDESGCYVCGDALKNGAEQCDEDDFGGMDCSDFTTATGDNFTGGSLGCTDQCEVHTTDCTRCGDGVVSGNETCDVGDLQGETCESQGFAGGSLQCALGCLGFNTEDCTVCGDGKVDGEEQCDDQNLDGQTCVSLGFASGTLSCSSGCTFDETGCAFPLRVCHAANLAMPDNNPTGVSDSLTVTRTAQLTDVNVFLQISHGWVGDVQASITHGGVTRTVIDRPGVPASTYGCGGTDIHATLDDEAASLVESACAATEPAISGSFQPAQSLSAFDGQNASGTWTLQAADRAGLIEGTLVDWCVELTWQ